jgi:thymidine phosphorylase
MTVWDAPSIIIAKRDRQPLADDAIRWFIDAYTRGEVADEQAAALCMAVFLNGLDDRELSTWTQAMIDSGRRFVIPGSDEPGARPLVDKHSTGGVGDKISLILCPLVAACGAAVPQVSGRGLGHTGGTLDKMAAIAGWRPELSPDQVAHALSTFGAVIIAASDDLAPADAKLYALRDVTGTVASIPLIASSIMSKKIASGTRALVLDVKVGRGAFMTELDRARQLAETMVGIGRRAGVATVALLTRMDQPLGRAVGNTLEVDESLDVLRGAGPDDVRRITVALAREMLALAGLEADPGQVLSSGRAMEVFDEMVRFQGGDLTRDMPRAAHHHAVRADAGGYIGALDALAIGRAAMRLGAGRARKEDDIDHGAGIECLAKVGDRVEEGEPVLLLHANDEALFGVAAELLAEAVTVVPEPPEIPDVVIERVD